MNSATVYLRLRAQGLTASDVQAAFVPVQLDARSLDAGAAAGEVSGATWGLTYALVLLLYMTIAIYGTYVAMGVIEEKSTRVVEILISTTRPFPLMVGKVVGIGIVALLQYAAVDRGRAPADGRPRVVEHRQGGAAVAELLRYRSVVVGGVRGLLRLGVLRLRRRSSPPEGPW